MKPAWGPGSDNEAPQYEPAPYAQPQHDPNYLRVERQRRTWETVAAVVVIILAVIGLASVALAVLFVYAVSQYGSNK